VRCQVNVRATFFPNRASSCRIYSVFLGFLGHSTLDCFYCCISRIIMHYLVEERIVVHHPTTRHASLANGRASHSLRPVHVPEGLVPLCIAIQTVPPPSVVIDVWPFMRRLCISIFFSAPLLTHIRQVPTYTVLILNAHLLPFPNLIHRRAVLTPFYIWSPHGVPPVASSFSLQGEVPRRDYLLYLFGLVTAYFLGSQVA